MEGNSNLERTGAEIMSVVATQEHILSGLTYTVFFFGGRTPFFRKRDGRPKHYEGNPHIEGSKPPKNQSNGDQSGPIPQTGAIRGIGGPHLRWTNLVLPKKRK